MAAASGSVEIPPGGQWPFQTHSVRELGTGLFAFAAGALAK